MYDDDDDFIIEFTPEFEVSEDEIFFLPGSFRNFEGTQEELDELVENIKQMFTSGVAFEGTEFIEISEEEYLEQDVKLN